MNEITATRKGGRPNKGGGKFNKAVRGKSTKCNFSSLHSGRKQSQNVFQDDFAVNPSFSPEKNEYHPKPVKRKVALQQLNICTENQQLIEKVLCSIRDGFSSNAELIDHKTSQKNLNKDYWVTDSKLCIQDISDYSRDSSNATKSLETVNKYAVEKLTRYGFDKSVCLKALDENDWEVGKALEYLLNYCIKNYLINDCSSVSELQETVKHDVFEHREDEKIALRSIFGDAFVERIPNAVWIIELNLPYLNEAVKSRAQPDEYNSKNCQYHVDLVAKNVTGRHLVSKPQSKKKMACIQNDRKMKSIHRYNLKQALYEVTNETCDLKFELEIRFPANNCYPYEAPLVCFCSQDASFPVAATLHITVLLLQEASRLSLDHLPVVYALTCLLEDNNVIEPLLHKKPLELSLPKENSLSNDCVSCNEESEENTLELNCKKFNLRHKKMQLCNKSQRLVSDQIIPVQSSKDIEKLRKLFALKQSSGRYQEMTMLRKGLPVWKQQDHILRTIENSQVVVISGLTGCGKTTQIPQFILDKWLKSKNETSIFMMCTQPRRISAISVATRVAEERDENLGETVGYQIRLESVQSSSTRLLYCTTGILLRKLEGSHDLSGITHILVDEVHERSEESDFLLMVLRKVLPRRPDLKLILMSATMDAELFSSYFNNCPVVEVPGKMFPVDQLFLEDILEVTGYMVEEGSIYSKPFMKAAQSTCSVPSTSEQFPLDKEEIDFDIKKVKIPNDSLSDGKLTIKQLAIRYAGYSKTTLKTLFKLDIEKINNDLIESALQWIIGDKHEHAHEGSILIFLPGMAEITSLLDQLYLHPVFGPKGKRFVIYPLHSLLSTEDQNLVFSRPKGKRKIILSTNIAETSVTIDDVVFVIDSGRIKESRYDPSKGMESLDTVWESKANVIQRKGRAGRVRPGVCIHLFTSFHFDHMRPQPVPEIQRAPLESLILHIKMLPFLCTSSVQDVLLAILEPPSHESIIDAVHRLQELGALDMNEDLTALGYHLSALPVDVRIGKLMLYGSIFQCLDSALTIAACLSYKSPFKSNFGTFGESDKKKMEFFCCKSDQLTSLKAYKGWQKALANGNGAQYCYDNNLSPKTLMMLASMKNQFVELLSEMGFAPQGLKARDLERHAKGRGDAVFQSTGPQLNANENNQKLLLSILCAALYPNVLQIMTPAVRYTQGSSGSVQRQPKPEELRFRTKEGDYVFIHPSSVNFHVSHYESPYLVFHEKVKTSKVYVRGCSMISPHALLLFGGGQLAVELHRGDFVLSLDGWMHIKVPSNHVAVLIKELRFQVDQLMINKIEDPSLELSSYSQGQQIINAIVQLLSTE